MNVIDSPPPELLGPSNIPWEEVATHNGTVEYRKFHVENGELQLSKLDVYYNFLRTIVEHSLARCDTNELEIVSSLRTGSSMPGSRLQYLFCDPDSWKVNHSGRKHVDAVSRNLRQIYVSARYEGTPFYLGKYLILDAKKTSLNPINGLLLFAQTLKGAPTISCPSDEIVAFTAGVHVHSSPRRELYTNPGVNAFMKVGVFAIG